MTDTLDRNDIKVYFGKPVKALGDGIIEGLGVTYTSPDARDLHGEYFDTRTDHVEDSYKWVDARILYNHGFDDVFSVRSIGKPIKASRDDAGIWLQAQLDMADEYEQMVYEMAKNGKLSWSSGALPQSVVVDEDGHISKWAIIEFSLTPTPAMPETTRIRTAKSLSVRTATATKEANLESKGSDADNTNPIDNQSPEKDNPMDESMIRQIIRMVLEESKAMSDGEAVVEEDDLVEAVAMDEIPDEEKSKMDDEELAKAVAEKAWKVIDAKLASRQKALDAVNAINKQKALNAPVDDDAFLPGARKGASRISVGENLKYAHLSASDMALGVLMQTAPAKSQGIRQPLGQVVSEDYARHMIAKMNRHADSQPYGRNAKSSQHAEIAAKANHHIKSVIPFKANELDASTLTGQGDEWVGEYWSTDLWERERFERHYDRMVSKGMWVQTIERGAETAYFPTEGSDPVAYTAPQANSVGSNGRPETTLNINPFGTGRVSLTPQEIKIATSHTTILEEDSVINIVQQVNRQLNEAALDTRDKLMVNGDTETGTTNINYDGSAPPTGLSTPYYIASNGLRKTGIAGGRDASGALNLEQYRLTLASLDPELRQYYEKMLFFIDPTTEMGSLGITEIKTDDVRRTNATIESGRILNIYGVDVVSNGWIPQTASDGKVTYNAAGTLGTILLAYAPYWGCAYKRQVTLETARDIYSGASVYVMSMRVGFVPRGANAAVASYNVATTAS